MIQKKVMQVHETTESAVNFLPSCAPNTETDDITSPRAYVKTCRIVFNYNRTRQQTRQRVVRHLVPFILMISRLD